MLELDRLTLARGAFSLTADWSLPAGTRVAVIGPSGGGKSTLLDALAGFLAPLSGRIRWQGQDITTLPPGGRPLSILFQDGNLFPHLTVAQNAGLGLSPGLRLTAEDRARVDVVLRDVGLEGLQGRRPADLSGGQQGRAALARALLRARPILLLDEPFAALGPALRAQMLDLTARMAAGQTVLLVTHDPAEARRFADLAVLVADGVAAAPVPVGPLLDDPPPALAAYLGL
ncbi:MAG TPA: ATP-binding cassette domain-containing protein [Paracoccaceae bacterium]|nr:ATP-binding cassette domain-containing protein [Paracoccaceae bacterium]HMO70391.1 ATP-binding cassette domain-containing protein [Paracoccaceae bacterium]